MTPSHHRPSRPAPLALLAAALVTLLAVACGDEATDVAETQAPPAGAHGLALEPQDYPAAVEEALGLVLAAYDESRGVLAAGDVAGVGSPAARLAASIGMTRDAGELDATVDGLLAEAASAASVVSRAGDLDAARAAFAELSRALIPVAAADPEVAAGWQVFECPMLKDAGFAKWMQGEGDAANPYMGPEMLSCATPSDWTVEAPASAADAAAHAVAAHGADPEDPDAIVHYTCSMHTSVKSPDPGSCPICGMELVPVTAGEVASGVVRLDAERRQRIGVTVEPVTRRPLDVSVRAVGKVVVDETRLTDVSVKYEGWIERLYVDRPGQEVRRGQPLFTLYSPELFGAQQEFLAALRSQQAAAGTAAPERADYLVRAARKRLRLWDLSDAQIDNLAATGEPIEQIPILSPASGFVVEKDVVAGGSVSPGMRLFRIAALDRVWVEAEVYESELALVAVGDTAVVTLPYLAGRSFSGRVEFVYPYLDGATRTGRVRIALPNPGLELKPEMFADVRIEKALGEALVVPEQAILFAGERRFVFVDLGEGRLAPRQVETGARSGQLVEVLSGLDAGDLVVTSGNFLVAAESRLKLAMDQWGDPDAVATRRPPAAADDHSRH